MVLSKAVCRLTGFLGCAQSSTAAREWGESLPDADLGTDPPLLQHRVARRPGTCAAGGPCRRGPAAVLCQGPSACFYELTGFDVPNSCLLLPVLGFYLSVCGGAHSDGTQLGS